MQYFKLFFFLFLLSICLNSFGQQQKSLEKVNLRMDVGFGPGWFHGIYFGIEEAF